MTARYVPHRMTDLPVFNWIPDKELCGSAWGLDWDDLSSTCYTNSLPEQEATLCNKVEVDVEQEAHDDTCRFQKIGLWSQQRLLENSHVILSAVTAVTAQDATRRLKAGVKGKKRHPHMVMILKAHSAIDTKPCSIEKQVLATRVGMSLHQVNEWFNNQRKRNRPV